MSCHSSMTTPPPFASIRELYAVKDELLHEMRAMEARLAEKIEEANTHHDIIHEAMRTRADDRHRRIDDYMADQKATQLLITGRSEGQSRVAAQVLFALRALNEFRWLIALVITGLIIMLNNVSVSIVEAPQ